MTTKDTYPDTISDCFLDASFQYSKNVIVHIRFHGQYQYSIVGRSMFQAVVLMTFLREVYQVISSTLRCRFQIVIGRRRREQERSVAREEAGAICKREERGPDGTARTARNLGTGSFSLVPILESAASSLFFTMTII